MEKISVQTGFGYYKDQQGRIVSKAELPPGEHPIKEGFTFTEVNNQAELDTVEVYQAPPTVDEINETKIQNQMRSMAIDKLKMTGDLPADFIDPRI